MRRRMKRFLAFFCSLVMLLTMAQVNAFAMSNDIDNHWAKNTIQTWMDQDLVSGYPDGTFRPDANITRAEYMALVNNAYSLTQETDISFLDVKASDWYYNIVRRALFAGYIGGYPDNKIRPNQPITRQEAAVIIAKIKGLEENPLRANDLLDGGSIDPWSKGYIGAVLEAGYMAGYPDGTFKAKNPIKRGEAVFALNNTIKDHEESEEITESIDEEDISVPTSPSSSSGGGGGGGGSQTIAVTTITVSGAGGASTITAVDGTLQMSVNVAPAEASNKSVTWSVTPQTGSATISSTGLLTAVANGTITVVATAQDGSGITGSRQIIISGQSTESVSNKAELEAAIDNNSITNIVLISSINDDIAQSTARTSSFTIDFGSHVLTGNLDITANNLSMITFNGDAGTRIDGDITLQATGATVNNNVAITGTATLNGVGFSSYNANRTHSGGIRMIGRGRLNLSGNAGGSDVEIDTADAVVIAGEANNVVIRQPNTSIRSSGSVANIIVDAGATGSRIERLSGSTISSLVANGAVTIAREDDVDIIGDVSGVAAGSVLQPVEYRLTLVADPLAGGTVTGAGSANSRLYTEGTVVDIDASANLGYNFDGWEATTGIFDAAGTANTNFHMPAQAVTVTANFSPIVVTDVEIDQDNHTIKTGTSSQLSATITPGNAVDQTVVWSSSNNEVAIVDNVGEVTGIAVGTAVITVATNDGGYSDTVIITVENREISSVETISEIYVAYATSLGAVEAQLPLTVEVILDDASTEMLTVIWDDGTPVYNGTISGTYVFEGTLILATGISNTASYVATVEVMVDVDKSALLAAIEAGNIKHDAAIEGIEIGEYASGAKVIFKMAIEAAEGVAADGSATQIAVNQAVSDLATAEGIFDGTQVTSIDKSALTTAITAAQAKHNAAVEGIEIGEYASGSKATFQTAIDGAQTVAGDGSATQVAVNQAVSDLATAEGIFDGAEITSIDKSALTTAITAAQEKHDAAVEGIEIGEYGAGSKAAFQTVIDGAQTIAADASATQVAVNQAVSDLATAEGIFDGAEITSIDKSTLTTAITAAQGKHDAAVEGIEIGEYGAGSKATFQSAIDGAQTVAGDGSATQVAVNQAVSDLATAEGIFDGTQVTSIDKSALVTEIAGANVNKGTVTVSLDGSEVLTTDEWVTIAVMTDYETAIGIAQGIHDDHNTTQAVVNQAVIDLLASTLVFNNAKAFGTLTAEPVGSLLDTKAGTNFIGVLYTRDGNIYYNQQDSDDIWGTEVMIGGGTEGRLAIDNANKPHVAYTTTEGKIGYRMYNGSIWSGIQLIESNHEGVCKWPSIDIDNANNPRITYVDTMGDTAGTTNQPDVMYAYTNNGEFVKQLLYSGYYDSYFKYGSYSAEKSPLITMDSNNNRYVLYQWRTYEHGMGVYHGRGLTVSGTNSLSLGDIGSNTNRYDIYDFKEVGGKLYALYRNNTEIKLSEMSVNAGGEIIGSIEKSSFVASSAYSFAIHNSTIVIGSKDGSNLRTHYNGTPHTFTEIVVKDNAVSVVNLGGTFYTYYTDNQDDGIKRLEITE